MSIVVLGKNEPKKCIDCPLEGYDNDDFVSWCKAGAWGEIKCHNMPSEKPENCPVIPLPDNHGRLVDVDLLIKQVETLEKTWQAWKIAPSKETILGAVKYLLERAETIIEKEEAE